MKRSLGTFLKLQKRRKTNERTNENSNDDEDKRAMEMTNTRVNDDFRSIFSGFLMYQPVYVFLVTYI